MIVDFLDSVSKSLDSLDMISIKEVCNILERLKGRLFIVGSGGGAGHASHAACDFRKLCDIEAYSFDNISELTARINDNGYDVAYRDWLRASGFNGHDCLMVISVGGGTNGVSENLNNAIAEAIDVGAKIVGIVGKDGGNTKKNANACVVIKTTDYITPITEGLQSVIWHLIVTYLQKRNPVW